MAAGQRDGAGVSKGLGVNMEWRAWRGVGMDVDFCFVSTVIEGGLERAV
jgi:hypothetical protein